jgi:pimeloyl-ACP methyl ester carboxylesterase
VRRILLGSLGCLVLAAGLALPGCGGTSSPRELGPLGTGADAYWLWLPHGKPKAVVVFLHGLDPTELTPVNHRPWLEHLARRGDDVVYPKYEAEPLARGALRHSLYAVNAAMQRLGRPKVPVVIVGYSRGGRLAVEFATVAGAAGAAPAAVMSVYPVGLNPYLEEVVDLRALDRSLKIEIATGQEDSHVGEQELLARLGDAGFPAKNVYALEVRSRGNFHADHYSAMKTVPEVQQQLWAPLDRLIDSVRR